MLVRRLSASLALMIWGGLGCWPAAAPAAEPAATAPAAEPAAAGLVWTAEQIEGDLRGEFTVSGHVVITYQDVTLKADRVTLNYKTKDVKASGHVELHRRESGAPAAAAPPPGPPQPGEPAPGAAATPPGAAPPQESVWYAETISGNLATGEFAVARNTLAAPPWYYGGDRGERDRAHAIRLWNADLTTCDRVLTGTPHWGLRASKLTLEKDGHYLAEHVYLHVLGVPVFYLPGLIGNRHRQGQYELRAGSRSDWGYWLHVGRRFQVTDDLWATVFAEYRQRRGAAGGIRGDWRGDRAASRFLVYGLRDENPLVDVCVNDRVYNGRYEPAENRFRLFDFTRWNLRDDLTFRAKLDYQSDNDLLFEFFRPEYELNPEPSTYADLSWLAPRYELSLNYRPRVNPFTSVVERLPELRLDLPRQPWGGTGLYYQGRTTAAELRLNFRDYDLPRFDGQPDNSDYASFRADSLHALYLPLRADWLQLVPRAAVRATYYGDSSRRPVTVAELNAASAADQRRGSPADTTPLTAYDDEGGARLRWAGELGTELSFTTHRTWPDFRSDWLAADGLCHVVQPYLNYTWMPRPSEDRDHLYFFDDTDRLDRVSFVRLGVYQELQTRRGPPEQPQRHQPLVRLENFCDYYFRPEPGQPQLGDFGSVLSLSPDPAFELTGKALFATSDWQLEVLNAGTRIGRPDAANLTVNYLRRGDYTQRYAYSMASDLTQIFASDVFPLTFSRNAGIATQLTAPLTAQWQFTAEHRYDLVDHELTNQKYTLQRDLHCWLGAVSYTRNNTSQAVEVSLALKAFPQTALRHAEDLGDPNE